jgi:acetoin utilization deacetylase AcuC-like enzyme
MVVFYSPRYNVDIGTHVFPTVKYTRVYERLQREHAADVELEEPSAAGWEELALVHTPQYLEKLKTGAFSVEELALLEIPWSPDVVEGFRLMTGGTIQAARMAVQRNRGLLVAHLGGGLHHAFPTHGEGFCMFNDVAVAARVMFREERVERLAVIDLDVHHGNGTAFVFENDPRVFTMSMHQENNYPTPKPKGSLDIGLPDLTRDDEYLRLLEPALSRVFEHRPDLVVYLAGADPYEDDQLGGLALTKGGLQERDLRVLEACQMHRVPTVVLLAGGYARNLEDTVEIHYRTVKSALALTQS